MLAREPLKYGLGRQHRPPSMQNFQASCSEGRAKKPVLLDTNESKSYMRSKMKSDLILLSNRALTENWESIHEEDRLLLREFKAEGLKTEIVAWEDVAAEEFQTEGFLFRTTWGYHQQVPAFKKLLRKLQSGGWAVWNSVDLIRWNLHKKYLLELERYGCPIVASKLIASGEAFNFDFLLDYFESDSLIFKPAIGASAHNTFHLNADISEVEFHAVLQPLRNQDVLVQAFVPNVVDEGEYSLVFIGGELSHTVLKQAQEGDFRVQSEYGGTSTKHPTPPAALRVAKKILDQLNEEPLYARVDLVRIGDNEFALMELELIEPQLFLSLQEGSATRLAQIISKNI